MSQRLVQLVELDKAILRLQQTTNSRGNVQGSYGGKHHLDPSLFFVSVKVYEDPNMGIVER